MGMNTTNWRKHICTDELSHIIATLLTIMGKQGGGRCFIKKRYYENYWGEGGGGGYDKKY